MAVRKENKPMDPEDLRSIVAGLIEDGIQYVDEELSPQRAIATEYYLGKPFGNEEEGRSQMVLTEVRDTIQGVLPSLLRVFFGPERVVEFSPRREGQVEQARQATDLVHAIIEEDGFKHTHSVLKDGLTKKLGIFKWGWEESVERVEEIYENVPEKSVALLLEQRGVTLLSQTEPTPEGLVTLTTEREDVTGRPWLAAVPPDEFIFTKGASTIDDALMVGHKRHLKRSKLISMGIDADILDEHGAADTRPRDNPEVIARQSAAEDAGFLEDDPEAGPANDDILYVESYVYVDEDGDGEAELRKICTVGPGYFIVTDEEADERPFSLYCPDPEPHTIVGQSWADRVMDMQKWKSSLVRAASDSAALSLFPRMGIVQGQVNIEDVLNTDMGAPIRMTHPNAILPIKHDFLGQPVLELLGYGDAIIERRTGKREGAAGLDANSLQSSTKEGVSAVLSHAQEQQELLARVFAEWTLKPLFRGLLRLIVKNANKPITARIRGNMAVVDTSTWDASLDVSVNVALGTGFLDERANTLLAVIAQQKEFLQLLGPDNPLVSLGQLRYAIARYLEAKGFRDVDAFFKNVPADWAPPPPQAPQQTPEQAIAQATVEVERMKTEKELEIKEAEFALKRETAQRETEIAREKNAQEMAFKERELQMKLDQEYRLAELDTKLELQKLEITTKVKLHESTQRTAIEEERLDQQREIAAAQLQQERENAAREHYHRRNGEGEE